MTAVVLAILSAGPAPCRAAYQEVRYQDAAVECRAALPAASQSELPELYRLLALSLSATGDHAAAQKAFISLLTIDPAATLSGEYSPRIRADLAAARAAGAPAPVSIDLATRSPALVGSQIELDITVDDGRPRPVSKLRVQSDATMVELPREGPLHATLPASSEPQTRSVTLTGFDAFGGRIAERTATFEVTDARSRPVIAAWQLWGSIGVASGIAGGVLGVLSRQQGELAKNAAFASDGAIAQQTANRYAITADACFAFAGAAVIAAIVLLATK